MPAGCGIAPKLDKGGSNVVRRDGGRDAVDLSLGHEQSLIVFHDVETLER